MGRPTADGAQGVTRGVTTRRRPPPKVDRPCWPLLGRKEPRLGRTGPRGPTPASWVARGRRRFPWPFGVSGSVGLRKESVSLPRAGPGDLTQEPHPASGRPCLRSLRKPQQAGLGAGRFLSSLCCSPSVKTQDRSRGPHFTAGGLTETGSLKARKRSLGGGLLWVPWRQSPRAARVGTPSAAGARVTCAVSSLLLWARLWGRGCGGHPAWHTAGIGPRRRGGKAQSSPPASAGSHGAVTTPQPRCPQPRLLQLRAGAQAKGPVTQLETRTRCGRAHAAAGAQGGGWGPGGPPLS